MDEIATTGVDDPEWPARRRGVLRDAVAVGVATGAYGLSFGALATAAGLSAGQASALSLLMFTGASQFALVAVLGAGGGPPAAAAAAILLGVRNAFYGPQLTTVLRPRGARRLLTAHLVIDESAALAVGRADPRSARLAFWATGLSVFVLWNVATLVGAVGVRAVGDPRAVGLDAAAPAAFLALLAPRLRTPGTRLPAIGAAVLGVALTPVTPLGVPVLAVAVGVVVLGVLIPARS